MREDLIQVKAEILRERAIGDELEAEVDRLRTLINLIDEQRERSSSNAHKKQKEEESSDESCHSTRKKNPNPEEG